VAPQGSDGAGMKTLEMKKRKLIGKRSNPHQHGYALLVVVFLCTLLLLSVMVVSPNIMTQVRREREQEMIWRGKQYVRAISLYRRKTGKFPPSIEDLAKGQPGIHFLRKPYKDPFNKDDGSWRLIYVGPAGQLVGSLNSNKPVAPFPVGANPLGPNPPASPTGPASTFGQGPAQQGAQNQPSSPGGASASPVSPSELPPGNVPDTPATVGGVIVGVGSKIDHSSVITFNKAHNYRLFEFIWDATKELNNLANLSAVPGQPAGDPNFHPPQPPPPDPKPLIPDPTPPQP
jgi:hypothetical protein